MIPSRFLVPWEASLAHHNPGHDGGSSAVANHIISISARDDPKREGMNEVRTRDLHEFRPKRRAALAAAAFGSLQPPLMSPRQYV